jgi:hypothetical protein
MQATRLGAGPLWVGKLGDLHVRIKNPTTSEFLRKSRGFLKEAPVGVEPTVADLQSAALASWRRRPESWP